LVSVERTLLVLNDALELFVATVLGARRRANNCAAVLGPLDTSLLVRLSTDDKFRSECEPKRVKGLLRVELLVDPSCVSRFKSVPDRPMRDVVILPIRVEAFVVSPVVERVNGLIREVPLLLPGSAVVCLMAVAVAVVVVMTVQAQHVESVTLLWRRVRTLIGKDVMANNLCSACPLLNRYTWSAHTRL
jgi:hypothetical protein